MATCDGSCEPPHRCGESFLRACDTANLYRMWRALGADVDEEDGAAEPALDPESLDDRGVARLEPRAAAEARARLAAELARCPALGGRALQAAAGAREYPLSGFGAYSSPVLAVR